MWIRIGRPGGKEKVDERRNDHSGCCGGEALEQDAEGEGIEYRRGGILCHGDGLRGRTWITSIGGRSGVEGDGADLDG